MKLSRFTANMLTIAAFAVTAASCREDVPESVTATGVTLNQTTPTLVAGETDHAFDTSFSGLAEYARSCLNHFDPAVRRSAENLDVIFLHYGNIGKESYRQELASSHNLVQELWIRKDDVAALNLAPWIGAHEVAAVTLAALLGERTAESAKQTDLRVRQVRRDVDTLYQQITDRIDAMINLHGKEFVPGFTAEYNAHATEYKNKLAQHLGRIHAGKNKDDK